jgi:hypothetical protein
MPTKNKHWVKAEEKAAEFFQGERVPGSGLGYRKSDVRQVDKVGKISVDREGGYRVEVKSSERVKFVIQKSWFIKIVKESKKVSQTPALFLYTYNHKQFVLIPVESLSTTVAFTGNSKSFSDLDLETMALGGMGFKFSEEDFTNQGLPKSYAFTVWRLYMATDLEVIESASTNNRDDITRN